MNIFEDDRIPTPEECIQEWTFKSQLKELEQECAQRKATAEALRSVEQDLRDSIIHLSNTLSQLYALTGNLTRIEKTKDKPKYMKTEGG